MSQDLTKWKNRRRSSKSDLRGKSQDREHVINQMINGASSNFEKNEAGKLLKRYSAAANENLPNPVANKDLLKVASKAADLGC